MCGQWVGPYLRGSTRPVLAAAAAALLRGVPWPEDRSISAAAAALLWGVPWLEDRSISAAAAALLRGVPSPAGQAGDIVRARNGEPPSPKRNGRDG